MNKTTKGRATKRSTKSKTTSRVSKNVYKKPSGNYEAYTRIDGVKVSKTFKLKRDAVNYINSLKS